MSQNLTGLPSLRNAELPRGKERTSVVPHFAAEFDELPRTVSMMDTAECMRWATERAMRLADLYRRRAQELPDGVVPIPSIALTANGHGPRRRPRPLRRIAA